MAIARAPEEAPSRPLRRDAAENRARIVEAASARFAADGLKVSLEDIARDAGVGIGTFYRHFRNRDALLEELFDESLVHAERIFIDSLAYEDAWEGLVHFFEDQLDLMINNRGLWLMAFHGSRKQRDLQAVQDMYWRYVTRLLRRAQKAGVVREDIRPSDFTVIMEMMRKSLDFTHLERPTVVRRYVVFILEGLRSTRPDALPMPERALTRAETIRAGVREYH